MTYRPLPRGLSTKELPDETVLEIKKFVSEGWSLQYSLCLAGIKRRARENLSGNKYQDLKKWYFEFKNRKIITERINK